MAKKVTTNYFWNVVCFIALALFATRAFFGIFNLSPICKFIVFKSLVRYFSLNEKRNVS